MIGRIIYILRVLWARPAVQASVWIVLESLVIWLKDKIVSYFNKPKQPPTVSLDCEFTPGETKDDTNTTIKPPCKCNEPVVLDSGTVLGKPKQRKQKKKTPAKKQE